MFRQLNHSHMRLVACLSLLLLLSGVLQAQEVADGTDHVLLTYDVSDLVMNVPDYPYSTDSGKSRGLMGGIMGGTGAGMGPGTGMGPGAGMGGGYGDYGGDLDFMPAGSTSGRISMMDLTRVIVAVISPDTWSTSGSGTGELQVLGNSLVVRQTPAVHQQVQDLLDQLRKGSGARQTVAIDARWLLLNSDDLEKLITSQGGLGVDRKVLAEFTRRPSSIRGLTNCFTGQLVYLVSGTRRSVVTSVIPVVGSLDRPDDIEQQYVSRTAPSGIIWATQAGSYGTASSPAMGMSDTRVGYQPVVERPNFGALLQIRPTLIPGKNSANVDLKSTITVPGQPSHAQNPPPVAAGVPVVDRLAIDTQELATTLSVPLGQPVLVGGLTYVSPSALTLSPLQKSGDNRPTGNETPQLYLVLELRSDSDVE